MFRLSFQAAASSVAVSFSLLAIASTANADTTDATATATAADASASASASASSSSSPQLQAIQVTAKTLNDARTSIETQTGASTFTIDSQTIANMPGGTNAPLNQVLLQAPDVVQDSFGQLHVRGDHNNIQYRLNGIILPEGISVFSQTLSPWLDRKSTRLNSSHSTLSRMPSSA